MLQIYFGWVGFHWDAGVVKNYPEEDMHARLWICFVGVIGVCYWNRNAAKMVSQVMRLALKDKELVANSEAIIGKRVEERAGARIAELEELLDKNRDGYCQREGETQRLLAEKNTRVKQLETTIKVLANLKGEGV